MTSLRCGAAAVCAGLLFAFGCVSGGGGGNPNDNSGVEPHLDPEVAQAVESISAQIESAFAALTTGVNVGADFDIDAPDSDCPAFDLQVGDDLTLTATFDYGDGCPSTLFQGQIVSGSVVASVNPIGQTIALDYVEFTLSDRVLDGTVNIAIVGQDTADRAIDATIDISTVDLGSVSGDLTVTTNPVGDTLELVITQAMLDVTNNNTNSFYAVTITDLVSNLAANGTFTPQAGTVSFDIAGAGPGGSDLRVVVTYQTSTPFDGIVQVQVGSLPVVEYELQGA